MSKNQRTYRAPRGIRDLLPEDVALAERMERIAASLATRRGFREIRPALLEETALFKRSVGEVTDIVEKEMFSFERGKTHLSLRPEGTAGIVRAYIEAGYPRNRPIQRFFHIGPMFRYERPQKGRERMFTQFDVEALGSMDPRLDAEVIQLAALFFESLGIDEIEVRINSMGDGDDRDRYRDAVRAFLAPSMEAHCDLCRSRFERNVLRVLDCKNPSCRELHAGAPAIVDFLSPENEAHFAAVRSSLERLGRKTVLDSGLVRGLDYYTRTVFELHHPPLGVRSALCGGGRYDHLVRDLGGPDLGAVGFAIGFTPTLLALEELGILDRPAIRPAADCFLVAAGEGLDEEVFVLAEELRSRGVSVVFDVEGKSLKSQMKTANAGGFRFALVLGESELERGVVQLKDLPAREQHEIAREELADRILEALAVPS
ncbi:MAG TPA: histidine--tRNA ligase [Planctomycetes bacterium]|nr:histidine--tRNA ligase [Planctomycetota bacterium]